MNFEQFAGEKLSTRYKYKHFNHEIIAYIHRNSQFVFDFAEYNLLIFKLIYNSSILILDLDKIISNSFEEIYTFFAAKAHFTTVNALYTTVNAHFMHLIVNNIVANAHFLAVNAHFTRLIVDNTTAIGNNITVNAHFLAVNAYFTRLIVDNTTAIGNNITVNAHFLAVNAHFTGLIVDYNAIIVNNKTPIVHNKATIVNNKTLIVHNNAIIVNNNEIIVNNTTTIIYNKAAVVTLIDGSFNSVNVYDHLWLTPRLSLAQGRCLLTRRGSLFSHSAFCSSGTIAYWKNSGIGSCLNHY
jgi:hypothetical protein